MKTYLSTLLGVCIISAAVRVIAPDGAMKKYIDVLCSLCVIAVVISPISSLIADVGGIYGMLDIDDVYEDADYEEIYKGYILEMNTENASAVLGEELCRHLGVKEGSLTVALSVTKTEDTVSVNGATVTVGAGAVTADPDEIKAYVAERVGCECQIIYELKNE